MPSEQPNRRSRWAGRTPLIVAALVVIAAAGAIANCAPLGGRATGTRLIRMQKSPEWEGSHFENPQPIVNDNWGAIATLLKPDPNVAPKSPLNKAWPDWHLGPEQAVEAHRRVRGAVMLPVHWGLFALASHSWTEPIERVVAAARDAGTVVITPRPGQKVEPTVERPQERWWPELPWHRATEDPIVAHDAD